MPDPSVPVVPPLPTWIVVFSQLQGAIVVVPVYVLLPVRTSVPSVWVSVPLPEIALATVVVPLR